MSIYTKNIRVLMLLSLFIFLLVSFSYAEDIDGYRGAKWGMNKEEVREVIKQLGLEYVDYEKFIVKDKIFFCDAEISYLVAFRIPLTMVSIKLKKPSFMDIPHTSIINALESKYGQPLKLKGKNENFRMWRVSKTSITYLGDNEGAFIIYSDLIREMEDERKEKEKL